MASIIANNLLYHFWSKAIFGAYLHEIILSCRYRYKKRCSDWGILKSEILSFAFWMFSQKSYIWSVR